MKARFLRDNAMLVALVVLCGFFATQSSAFLTLSNMRTIAINSSVLAVVVVAAAALLIAGHLDLSIGSTAGLAGVVSSMAVIDWNLAAGPAIVLGLLSGASVGAVNGFFCGILGFNPIIVTLGMLSVVRGITLLATDTALFGIGGFFNTLATAEFGGFPLLVAIGLFMFLVGAVFLYWTPWGRHTYAVGVNPLAAYLAGIPVRGLVFSLYVWTGMSAGLAGILLAARLDGATAGTLGLGLELSALTAVLIGGVAFAGGRGSLSGVFFAVILLGALQNGLILMNVSPFIQLLAQGTVLIIAAALDRFGAYFATRARLNESTGAPDRDAPSEVEPTGRTGIPTEERVTTQIGEHGFSDG